MKNASTGFRTKALGLDVEENVAYHMEKEGKNVKMTEEQKKQIDAMSQYEMCRRWRFSKVGDPLFQGEIGDYFSKVLKEKGGFTPEISKSLGR
jgi:hypothetical protein